MLGNRKTPRPDRGFFAGVGILTGSSLSSKNHPATCWAVPNRMFSSGYDAANRPSFQAFAAWTMRAFTSGGETGAMMA
jgi:hypothetical protein